MSVRFWSTAAGDPFFQPSDLHVEPADRLVQFGLEGLSLLVLAPPAVAEEGLDAVEELLLPLADLDGVDLVRLGEFGDGPGLRGGLQGDPGLEGGRVAFTCAGHETPRDGAATFDQFNIPSCPVSGVHFRLGAGAAGVAQGLRIFNIVLQQALGPGSHYPNHNATAWS
jgi:hypothetical protein